MSTFLGHPLQFHIYFFQVKKDPMTGESRGFGFVSFADNKVAETVLSRTHTILGRRCEVRLPRPKVGQKVIILTDCMHNLFYFCHQSSREPY